MAQSKSTLSVKSNDRVSFIITRVVRSFVSVSSILLFLFINASIILSGCAQFLCSDHMLICRIASAFDLTHTLVRPSDALFPSHSANSGWMILASWNYTAAWVIMSDSLKGIRGHHWYWSHYRYSEWARTRLAICQDALNLAFSPFTPCNEILVLSAKESSAQAASWIYERRKRASISSLFLN